MSESSNVAASLSEQNNSVQKLVYGISHDMSAPLRAVVQLSQMLKNRVGDRLDEKEGYWLQLIEENGCHAQKMIEALLVFSRLSTHRQPESQFLLRHTLQQVIDNLDAQIERASATIKIEGEWLEYTGCEQQWSTLFTCLLENALLYQPKNDGHVPLVNISCNQTGGQLCICIEDNGIGVRENLWSVLTTPFKRMQSEKDYPGIGMGLAYCERIAELHGGILNIGHSSLGGIAITYIERE